MYITDGKTYTHVKPGLIDKGGIFFLLVDDNDTGYYKFSNQADVIDALFDERDELRERVDSLQEAVDGLSRSVDRMKQENKRLTDGIENEQKKEHRAYERARRAEGKLRDLKVSV